MSRACFEHMLEQVQHDFPRQGMSTNGKSLIPAEKLLLFMYYITGDVPSHHHIMAADLGLGTLNNAIHETIQVLYDKLVPLYVQLPKNGEGEAEGRLFSAKSGWPLQNLWAATDGTNIRVRISNVQQISIVLQKGL